MGSDLTWSLHDEDKNVHSPPKKLRRFDAAASPTVRKSEDVLRGRNYDMVV